MMTDHAALTYLMTQAHLSRRQARWLDFLSQFDLKFEHVPGKKNVADYLSRIPGADLLKEDQVCGSSMTLGVLHFCDVAGDA